MTIKEQMAALEKALKGWAKGNGAVVTVAGDPVSVLDVLRTRPGSVMAALVFDSETPRVGEWNETGKVVRGFRVVVSRGRGFRPETGESLTEGTGGGKAMFDLAEEAREVVRQITLPEPDPEDQAPEYAGIGAFTVQGFILDAYEVRVNLGTQIPVKE